MKRWATFDLIHILRVTPLEVWGDSVTWLLNIEHTRDFHNNAQGIVVCIFIKL